ncbi:MAG: glycosyltransferase [Candidatus Electrothrix scaldis]|nr:MAG: glycosyltransferase [Candidatus Electrothrix sp. GW3-3]
MQPCGIKKAQASLIVTLDGDGQNDPGDIEKLVALYNEKRKNNPCCLINGYRSQRKDSGWRCFSSLFANAIRRLLLRDATPDSGCGIKAYAKETFLDLPPFNHMHRFLPALVRQQGGNVVSVEVKHRPRKSGKSHYGTLDRLFAGVIDLLGVLWLSKRAFPSGLIEEEHHE